MRRIGENQKTKIRSLEKQINFLINNFYFYKSFEITADLMKGTPRVFFYQSLYKMVKQHEANEQMLVMSFRTMKA